ncbi:hypothetical protein ACJMK2_012808 [Sinanodonta woodiana]|uniref:Importin subunit alpha n=1 Tax=Sinanodonta woodiana TaxID=1069815 RepID=A0ABD3VAK9_SINWO
MDRKGKYKHHAETVEEIRSKRREEDIVLRKDKRDKLISAKRFRFSKDEPVDEDITAEEVINITKQLLKHGPHRLTILQTLRQAFSQGTVFIDAFFSVDNSLHCLVGLLTGTDVDLQLEAAWCITNISAGTHEHALAIVKSAAPYLIIYLSSNNSMLQDQCAWAIGNLAGDGKECRSFLHAQGVVAPLVKLLQSPMPAVVQSSAFAISNIARESQEITRDIVKCGVIPLIPQYLTPKPEGRNILTEVAWVLTYISTSGEHTENLVRFGIMRLIVDILVKLVTEQPLDGQAITPLMRCLGNICSGPDEYSLAACDNSRILHALSQYLSSSIRHIIKETLWVLSNMAGEPHVCQSVASEPLLSLITKNLSLGFDIKQEALYVLCNIAWHGEETTRHLVQQGVLHHIVPILKSSDVELLNLALAFCEMALRMCPESVQVMEQCDGVTQLEGLEYHRNADLASKASHLLETYFYMGDEEVEELG